MREADRRTLAVYMAIGFITGIARLIPGKTDPSLVAVYVALALLLGIWRARINPLAVQREISQPIYLICGLGGYLIGVVLAFAIQLLFV